MENENILNQEKTSLVKDLQNNIFQEFNELLISNLKFENKDLFLMEKFLNGIDDILNNYILIDLNDIAIKYFTVSINLSKEYKMLKLYDEALEVLERAEYKNFNIENFSNNFFIYKSFLLKEKIELFNVKNFPNINILLEIQKLLKLSQYCLNFVDFSNENNVKNLITYSYFNIINQCFYMSKFNEVKAFYKDFEKIVKNLNISFIGKNKIDEVLLKGYNINADLLLYQIDETIFDRIEENLKDINILLNEKNLYEHKEKLTSILIQNLLFLLILNKDTSNNEFLLLSDDILEKSLNFLKNDIDNNNIYVSNYLNAIFIVLNFLELRNLNFEDYLNYVVDIFKSINLENKISGVALNIYLEIKNKIKLNKGKL